MSLWLITFAKHLLNKIIETSLLQIFFYQKDFPKVTYYQIPYSWSVFIGLDITNLDPTLIPNLGNLQIISVT